MDRVDFQGNPGDLKRFADRVLKRTVHIDTLSPSEHRMRWDANGSSGSSSSTSLHSGIKLNATQLRWEHPWTFQFRDGATPFKFLLGLGRAPRMSQADGESYVIGEGVVHVRHVRRAVDTTCEFFEGGGAECQQLALEIEPNRLKELLGAPVLPEVLAGLLTGNDAYGAHAQPIAPAAFRLLDEVLHVDTRGRSRQLFLESKALELLAVLIDDIELMSQARAPFGPRDLERLEKARRLLLERMSDPPSLHELARQVGLNEVKLKTGFRSLFGATVFGYLRAQRMESARRLLVQRGSSVTEVALRVGYTNPSKFAAAFRKHFGFAPSALR